MPPNEKVLVLKKTKLELYGLAALVILLIIGGWLLYGRSQRMLVEQKKTELKLLADNIAADHEGAIFGIRQFLLTSGYLAENLEDNTNIEDNTNNCEEILRRMYVVYPYFINIGVTDSEGNVICSGVDIGRLVNIGNDPDFIEAKTTSSFTVSGYRISNHTGRPSVRFIQPILKESVFSGVIFVTFATDWLNGFSPSFDLPEETTLTKFDADGVVFMRYPNPLTWSGTDQHDSFLFQAVKENKIGFVNAQGLDGKNRMYYFRPIYQDGKIHAYVVVGSSKLIE